uniref:GNAT family N-acetyltransferase n=1 Tax=Streptomyces sp. W75 TaxID=1170711 RepID=UPI0039AEA088
MFRQSPRQPALTRRAFRLFSAWHDQSMGKASRRRAENRTKTTMRPVRPPVITRPLTQGDLPQVMPLLKDVIVQDTAQALAIYLEEPSTANRFPAAFVAELDRQVVGVVAGVGANLQLPRLEVPPEQAAQRIGLLDILAVHPGHQGSGIGALLCDLLLESFRERGTRLVLARVASGRRDLVPVYNRWGWSMGNPSAGVAVQVGSQPLALMEDPGTRIAWKALASGVRLSPSGLRGQPPVVSGVF